MSVSAAGMPVSRSTSRRSSMRAGLSSARLVRRRFDATRFRRSGRASGATCRALSHRAAAAIWMPVGPGRCCAVGGRATTRSTMAWSDQRSWPSPPLDGGAFLPAGRHRRAASQRYDQEVARADRWVEQPQAADGLGRLCYGTGRDGLRHEEGPAALRIGVPAASAR